MADRRMGTADTPTGTGSRTQEQAREKASELSDTAKAKGGELAEQAKQRASSQAAAQKDRASEHLDRVGSALHDTSGNLRNRDEDAVAGIFDQAAHQVDRLHDYLETHSVSDLLNDTQRFARREPGLFLGGAALLGLFGARFFRSSGSGYRSGTTSRSRPRYSSGDAPPSYRERPESVRSSEGYDTVHRTSGGEVPETSRSTSTHSVGFEDETSSRESSERTR